MTSTTVLCVVLFVLGLLIGSFLNVVIWRVPRGESINHPSSHCPGCGHPIRAYDNIPVVSWLLLRGKCRDCGEPISVRYPLVELATGLAFAATGALLGLTLLLVPMLWFVAAAISIFMIDIDVRKIPNAIVIPSWVVVGVGLAITGLVEPDTGNVLRAALGALAMGGAYLLLALLYPAGMGMGDVKLAVLLGMVLGWFGWSQVLVGFFAGFLFGAVWGLGVILVRRGGRKTAVPFAPFMIVGTVFALLFGSAVAGWYAGLLP